MCSSENSVIHIVPKQADAIELTPFFNLNGLAQLMLQKVSDKPTLLKKLIELMLKTSYFLHKQLREK